MSENLDSLTELEAALTTPLPDCDSDGPHLSNDVSIITETNSAKSEIDETMPMESSIHCKSMPENEGKNITEIDTSGVFDEFLNKIKNKFDSVDDINAISEVVEKIRHSKSVVGNQFQKSSSNSPEIEGEATAKTSEPNKFVINCEEISKKNSIEIENSNDFENSSIITEIKNDKLSNSAIKTNSQFADESKSNNKISIEIESKNNFENTSAIGKENNEIRNHDPGTQNKSKLNSHLQLNFPLSQWSPENFLESQKPSTSGLHRDQLRLLSSPEQFINGQRNTGAISKNIGKTNRNVNQSHWFCSLCNNRLHANRIVLKHCKHGFCSHCLVNYAKSLSTARYLPCPHTFRNGGHCKKFFLHREVNLAATNENNKKNMLISNIERNSNDQIIPKNNNNQMVNLTAAKENTKNNILITNPKPKTNTQIISNTTPNKNNNQMAKTNNSNVNSGEFCIKLLNALDVDLYPNPEKFKCQICFNYIEPLEGVRLHECLHDFCKECLVKTIKHCENPSVRCPYSDTYRCESELQQREIKELLLTLDYYKYLDRTLSNAEKSLSNSFHCKTPNCHYFWDLILETEDMEDATVTCEVCEQDNCIKCQVIHAPLTCQQYRQTQVPVHEQKSLKRIGEMIDEREAMRCTKCRAVVSKVDGCDGIKCVICNTDLCWATKGPRWGPNGKNDTSGGCRCDPKNRRMCTPNCTGCH